MSTEMTLEADTRLKREDVKKLMTRLGAIDFSENSDNFTARLPESNMLIQFRDQLKNRNPLTTGMEASKWEIGSRMTFRYFLANFDKCESDLRIFVKNLAKNSEAFFVVAFQYENIWAKFDQDGLVFKSR